MAQITELSVLALPGMVHSFNAKATAGGRLCGQVTNEPKYAGTITNVPKYSGTITNEPKYGGDVTLVKCS